VANGAGGVFSWDWTRVANRATEDPDATHDGDHHAAWIDVDGDALQDYVITESGYSNNRIYLFRQGADHRFRPDTPNSGFHDINTANHVPGNVVPLDYDLDGDEDLLIGLDDAGIRLYRNDVGNQRSWIAVTLRGVGAPGYANRAAIGARVEVTAGGITQTKEVWAGNGHQGPQRPLRLTFGLGSATVVDRIRVRWPNASLAVSEQLGVAVNQAITLLEPCAYATDPAHLRVDRAADDLRLTWDDPAAAGWTWNVYRQSLPNPPAWGPAHASGVTDGDPGTPGIQHVDAGAVPGESFYYLVTARNVCGETPLP
jgi:hypothetical protein